jgi:hypothetical protein
LVYRRRPNANLEHAVNIHEERCGVNIVLGLFSKYFWGAGRFETGADSARETAPNVAAPALELTEIGLANIVSAPQNIPGAGGYFMAIYRLIANGSFDPDTIEAMTKAYEAALTDLRLVDRNDPLTELIAKSIVGVAGMGERDPNKIKERALNALGVRSPDAVKLSEPPPAGGSASGR